MSGAQSGIGSHLAGQGSGLRDAVTNHLEEAERVEYSLVSEGGLEWTSDGDTETIAAADWSHGVALASDRRLLFAVETPERETRIVDIPYTDLRHVTADDGLFSSTLTVEVWPDRVYEFTPTEKRSMDNLAEFVTRASDHWQRVAVTLERCQELTERLCADLEAGRPEAARDGGKQLEQTFEKAQSQAESAQESVKRGLAERIRAVRTACYEQWLHARIERAESLIETAETKLDERAYGESYRQYERARAQLERALLIDIEYGFDETTRIQSTIETVETRLADLEVRPMALAKQAEERAIGTDKQDVAVEAWAEAFEHYRDALTAGWGTDIRFGETETLRGEIEFTVQHLVDGRHTYAQTLESDGEYERAYRQIDAAVDLATQFRSGHTDELRKYRERLEATVD